MRFCSLREIADDDIPYVCEYLASARVFQRIECVISPGMPSRGLLTPWRSASYCELSLNSIDAIGEMLKEGKHIEEIECAAHLIFFC